MSDLTRREVTVHANEWLRCRLRGDCANASAPLGCMISHVCNADARMPAQHLIVMGIGKGQRKMTDLSRRSTGPSRNIVSSVPQPFWASEQCFRTIVERPRPSTSNSNEQPVSDVGHIPGSCERSWGTDKPGQNPTTLTTICPS